MSNLTKIRGKHGMTQTELGKLVCMTRAGMSYLEKNPLTVKNARKFAELLNENIFDILGDDVLKLRPETDEDKEKVINIILGFGCGQTPTTSIGERIKTLRKGLNLTVKDLSDLTGISVVALYSYEHGNSIPSPYFVSKLANALNIEFEELIKLVD